MFQIKMTRRAAAAESSEILSALILKRLAKLDTATEKGIAMLSKEIQDLVTKAREATDMVKSVDAGMAALRKQNDELKAKLDAIVVVPPVTTGDAPLYALSEEDKAGLAEIAKGFDDAIAALKDDIPANVQPPTPPIAVDGTPATEGQPAAAPDPIPDPETHAKDAEAAAAATPLPGTSPEPAPANVPTAATPAA